jgi:hypothetical protein
MQSTGHSSTHALSLMSMHGSAMTYAMRGWFPGVEDPKRCLVAMGELDA